MLYLYAGAIDRKEAENRFSRISCFRADFLRASYAFSCTKMSIASVYQKPQKSRAVTYDPSSDASIGEKPQEPRVPSSRGAALAVADTTHEVSGMHPPRLEGAGT